MDVVPAFSWLFPASSCCHGFPSSSTLGLVPVPFACPSVMQCLSCWDLTSVPTQNTRSLRLCPRACDLISFLCYPRSCWIVGDWNGATGDGWIGVPGWCCGMDEVSLLFLYHLYMLLIRHSSPFSYAGYDADLGMRWGAWHHEASGKLVLSLGYIVFCTLSKLNQVSRRFDEHHSWPMEAVGL